MELEASPSARTSWVSMLLFLLAATLAIGATVLLLVDCYHWWRLRHIPGPWGVPLLGVIPYIMRHGGPEYFSACTRKYGGVYKVAVGRKWCVVAADAESLRQAGMKLRNHEIIEPSLMHGVYRTVDDFGLFQTRDEVWRLTRLAWQPAFSAASLSGYLPLMVGCARKLVARLEDRAAGTEGERGKVAGGEAAGEAAGRLDLWRELGRMTLTVVGTSAYGVDLNAMGDGPTTAGQQVQVQGALKGKDPGEGSTEHYGPRLVQACNDFFHYMGAFTGSSYKRVALLLPELQRPLTAAAYALPDKPFAALLQSRHVLMDACLSLIHDWKQKVHTASAPGKQEQQQQQQQQDEHKSERDHSGTVDEAPAGPLTATTGTADGNGGHSGSSVGQEAADSAGGGRGGARAAAAAGSFLHQLLAARDRGGSAMSDLAVVGQVQTFLLGGYETTANAISFAVHCMATNPEVESKLLAEIDSVLGRERAPTDADLPRLPYTEAVLQEAMRLYPPAHATTRSVDEQPVQVGGYTLPPRTPVILHIYSVHRDPAVWPRPDEFIPERFLPSSPLHAEVCARVPHAHVPFGVGSRLCIGWKFSLQEAKVALALLYQRLTFELEPGQVPIHLVAGITLAPRDGLWVRPVLRAS